MLPSGSLQSETFLGWSNHPEYDGLAERNKRSRKVQLHEQLGDAPTPNPQGVDAICGVHSPLLFSGIEIRFDYPTLIKTLL